MTKIRQLGWSARALIVLAVAGMAVGVASIVSAAIPDANGVVSACYSGKTGQLRVIDTGAIHNSHCLTGEHPLDLVGQGGGNESWFDSGEVTGTGFTPVTVASLALPAGNFTLDASGWIFANNLTTPAHVNSRCWMGSAPNDAEDAFVAIWPASSSLDEESYGLSENVVGPTTVNLQCLSEVAGTLDGGRIVATRVGTLHGVATSVVGGGGALTATPGK